MIFGRSVGLYLGFAQTLLGAAVLLNVVQLSQEQVGAVLALVGAALALIANQAVTGSLFGRSD